VLGAGIFWADAGVVAPTSAGPYGCAYEVVGPNTGANRRLWGRVVGIGGCGRGRGAALRRVVAAAGLGGQGALLTGDVGAQGVEGAVAGGDEAGDALGRAQRGAAQIALHVELEQGVAHRVA
jgi:hypothetical protein